MQLAFPVESYAPHLVVVSSGHVPQPAVWPRGDKRAAPRSSPGTEDLPGVGDELNGVDPGALLALDDDDLVVGIKGGLVQVATVAAMGLAPLAAEPDME